VIPVATRGLARTRVSAMVSVMTRRSYGRSIGGMLLAAGLALGGCKRQEASAEPGASAASCNPADDCNDLIGESGGFTVREHSDQAATFGALSQGCPYAREDVPPLASLDDGSIPQFNAARSRRSNMNRGNEFLQEIDMHEHMMGMQDDLFACVDLAACYEDGAALSGYGDLDFRFELHPDGHVVAVSVKPSPGLDHPSVVACARRTLADYRFPRYDGGQMMVSYTVTMEEVPDA
jgi:hypothetical protein